MSTPQVALAMGAALLGSSLAGCGAGVPVLGAVAVAPLSIEGPAATVEVVAGSPAPRSCLHCAP